MNKEYKDKHIIYVPKSNLPALLKEIPDKPEGLYMCGNKDLLYQGDLTYICIIGSRKYTPYGYDVCKELIEALRGKPVAIVSGLALGIDSIAHRTALDVGLPCIAVPGSGLGQDVLYPRSHVRLAEEVVEKGGLLISEYESTLRASPWTFPMRNRIMAGLSHAVLIIEGEEDSGTLITARLALEYNRDVLAVPGSIFSPSSRGPLNLIKKGAVPICSVDDLLEALGLQNPLTIQDETKQEEQYSRCSPEEHEVLEALSEPQSREELLSKIKFDIGKLQVVLSMLELRGLITEECGYISRRFVKNR